MSWELVQGSKIALVRSYLRVPQAAGQVKILIFLMEIKYFPIYANNFCNAGQVLILRYFEACSFSPGFSPVDALNPERYPLNQNLECVFYKMPLVCFGMVSTKIIGGKTSFTSLKADL